MNPNEIIEAMKPAFPEIWGWNSGGGLICPYLKIGDNGAYALISDAEVDDRTKVMVGYYRADTPEGDMDEGTLVLTEGSIDEAIAMVFALRAREEIFGDFEGGELADVRSFEDLHNVCDANVYLVAALEYDRRVRYPNSDSWDLPNAVAEYIEALGTFNVDAPTVN